MKFLCKLGAITLYLGCMYIALGPAAGNIFTLKDVAVFAVGCAVFFFFTSRDESRTAFRDILHRVRTSCLCSGVYSSVVLSFAFFLDGASVRANHAFPVDGTIAQTVLRTCRPLLYSFLLYLILRLFDAGAPEEADAVSGGSGVSVDGREIIRDSLSKREMEVALLIAEGHTNIEIGQKLFISPFTVKKHAYNIFAKLNVQQRSEIKYLLDSSHRNQ